MRGLTVADIDVVGPVVEEGTLKGVEILDYSIEGVGVLASTASVVGSPMGVESSCGGFLIVVSFRKHTHPIHLISLDEVDVILIYVDAMKGTPAHSQS